MHWPLAYVNQILHWAENGALRPAQVARLQALAPLQPARAAWLGMLERLGLWGGALLLALAVVFFFAWNWDDLHHFAKIALAAAAVLGCVAAALPARVGGLVWQAALLGAALCSGALLALIGQIYQTGADIWELFAAWALLMLPFVLLARAWPTWLLCLLVGNLGLGRFLLTVGLRRLGFDDEAASLALVMLFNGLWWLAAWRGGRWMLAQPGPQIERVAAALALAALAFGAVLGAWDGSFGLYVPLFLLVAGGAFWFYRHHRLDIVMLGVLGCCAVAVAGSLLARVLFEGKSDVVVGLLIMGAFVLTASGYLSVWLKDLYRTQNRLAQEGA